MKLLYVTIKVFNSVVSFFFFWGFLHSWHLKAQNYSNTVSDFLTSCYVIAIRRLSFENNGGNVVTNMECRHNQILISWASIFTLRINFSWLRVYPHYVTSVVITSYVVLSALRIWQIYIYDDVTYIHIYDYVYPHNPLRISYVYPLRQFCKIYKTEPILLKENNNSKITAEKSDLFHSE